MPRHQLTYAERSRGGKTRAAQSSFREACQKGFWATMEAHPYFARHWLKKKLKAARSAKQNKENR
jgi:hypothetical protein